MPNGTRFSASVTDLRDMAGRLRGLQEEFNDQEDLISDHAGAAGSDEVDGALEDFASNWSDKREECSEMLQEVAGYAQIAADGYAQTEGALVQHIAASRPSSAAGSAGG